MKNDEFLIAGIAVDNTTYGFDRLFSYKVPDHLFNVKVGQRVLVPFGRGDRFRQGMILSLSYGKEENLGQQYGYGALTGKGLTFHEKECHFRCRKWYEVRNRR